MANYSEEIENTGDAIAELGSAQVNFVDDSGSIVGTSDMSTPVPNVLSPSETAFLGDSAMWNAVDNTNKELVDDIRLAAGLYDSEGKLVAVLKESLQVSLNPNNTADFEIFYPNFPKDIKGKVTEM